MSSARDLEHLLRRDVDRLAREADVETIKRYAECAPWRKRLDPWRRFRVRLARILRRLKIRRSPPPEPWRPCLRHVEQNHNAETLVIWALGTERQTLRQACRGLQAQLPASGVVPVLITDVADFAFYSRLGWLVEYVPTLSAPAGHFAERKQQYLAWLYRDAPALPIEVGLGAGTRIREMLEPSSRREAV